MRSAQYSVPLALIVALTAPAGCPEPPDGETESATNPETTGEATGESTDPDPDTGTTTAGESLSTGTASESDSETTAMTTDSDSATDSDSTTDSDSATESGGATTTWCADADGDGHGDPGDCTDVPDGDEPPPGTVPNADDCDDTDPDAHPGAAEHEPDLCAVDSDGDGWGDMHPDDPGVEPGSDCNDGQALIHANCLCEPVLDGVTCEAYNWKYEFVDDILGVNETAWAWDDVVKNLCEENNGPPTGIVCDEWRLQDGVANVVFSIDHDTDRDYIGFVFGWVEWGQYYIFHWKSEFELLDVNNVNCIDVQYPFDFVEGMMIKKINAEGGDDVNCIDMHFDGDTPNSQLMWGPGDSPETIEGWEYATDYLFHLEYDAAGFVVTISDDLGQLATMIVEDPDGTFDSDQLEVFSLSQINTCFSGFAKNQACMAP